MIVVSKFEKLYLLRIVFIPIICFGLSILLVDVKINYKKDVDVIGPVIFLLILGCSVLFYNLSLIYKIIVEETKIKKVYFLSRKTEIISYEFIKSFEKEFIDGMSSSEVGQISDGYSSYAFNLLDGNVIVISPLCFKNYEQLILAINDNRRAITS